MRFILNALQICLYIWAGLAIIDLFMLALGH